MNAGQFARKRALIERRAQGRTRFQRKAVARLILEAKATAVFEHGRMVGWRMAAGGVVCVKIRFRDQVAAMAELARLRPMASHHKVPVRSYSCGHCRGWHLTSKA